MTFQEFYAERKAAGLPHGPQQHELAQAAWDAALCAASAACFERGKLKDAQSIHAGISNLHTWVTREEVLS